MLNNINVKNFHVKNLSDSSVMQRTSDASACSKMQAFKMVPFESLGAVSYDFHSNYGSICISSEIKPDIGHKSWFFHTPLHSALSLRWSLSEYCHPVWCGITRMVGLPDGEKNFEDMYNRLHTIPACDGRADRQTSCDCIVRAMHTRRAVKTVLNIGSLLYFIYFSILLLT